MRDKLIKVIESSTDILVVLCLLMLMILVFSGCSTMHILKDCHAVEELDGIYVCKNLKPWE